ncbi:hypothetical protein [Halorubrum sp. AJ67]|uniref:hypothetical protein n=1 Tax=Halorubrum sp. AJ67 TaxID=1173487 RepID=UPI0003DC0BB2|nr:hypothetical protein [Halorubrum sp. AJ67]CDK38132.1 hypothetical protein BN903_332 [Halorubrum sp. AJ67]
MSDSTPDITDVKAWLDDEYNQYMSTYLYDNYLRLTNGSAAHFVDIRITDDEEIQLFGERYGDQIDKRCEATRESLLETLSSTI